MTRFSRVCVMGMGYIGLPTSAVFANHGLEVLGVDVKPAAVESINRGQPHIVEPELDVLLRQVVQAGRLRAALTPEPADAFILAVPTPFMAGHEPDTSHIEAAARAIAHVLARGNLVILESTSPIGTTEQLSRWLAQARPDLTFPHQAGELSDIRIAHCPERVLPGHILREVVENDRIIGGLTRKCAQAATLLYRVFAKGQIHPTNARTAEMAKLAENAFRDVNIAFANELSMICDRLRINVWELIRLANMHPRVNILRPGPGVGGHCIAVDPWFIVAADPERSPLIRTAREVNEAKPGFVVDKVRRHAATLKQPVIACLGLSYKADVDDLRESPAVTIVEELARAGVGELLVVEPHVNALPENLAVLGLQLWDFDRATERANILLLLVDHASFLTVDHDVVKDKIVVDTRGAW
ncbi:UDP-N-acetyl-D-mannosamine dehydrogenase [Roseococcus suduntuyensis]|uniref:UDP-N-acetyl-D-mannosaminuronic acid dehydrogenase n=1 Tax=Roseococcus suduntuyensis TaxID=455361 RepID=A0A840AEE4_9PROT|nr:UDP-N-acetyl-D-mannosamine dehydrogenase [Roseococcus suduntuyensis]MBB3900268.1 UDP-N-acetyl-D-mannosaminuronic acid dehydrogenase [Roseococcus suduntuyensis]